MILRFALALALVVSLACRPVPAAAESYQQALTHLAEHHKRILAAKADVDAAKAAASKARSGWFPDLTLTSSAGHQRIYKNNTDPTTHKAKKRKPTDPGNQRGGGRTLASTTFWRRVQLTFHAAVF